MLNTEPDASRERLITQVLGARTLLEIAGATQALTVWLEGHPDEQGMADGFEQISMMRDIAQEAAGASAEARGGPLDVGRGDGGGGQS